MREDLPLTSTKKFKSLSTLGIRCLPGIVECATNGNGCIKQQPAVVQWDYEGKLSARPCRDEDNSEAPSTFSSQLTELLFGWKLSIDRNLIVSSDN